MSRRPGAPAVAAAAAVTLALGGACESGPTPVEDAEEAIAGLVAERVDLDPSEVVASCPEDATMQPGSVLACDVVVADDAPVEVAFAFGEVEGDPASLRRAVIPTAAAEEHLAGQLSISAEGPVEVDCGDQALVVREVGGTFRCVVERTADGASFDVTVTVLGLDGTVRHRVEPTTTTVAPTVPPATDPGAPTTVAP